MHTRNLLLASLLVALYGCQPETPAQPPATPAAEQAIAPAPVAPAAMTPAPAPAQAVESLPVAKPAPVVQEKTAAVKQEAAATKPSAPAPASVAPVAKVEPASVAMAVKPALSEADALGLAKKNGCLVCHAIDKKVVGPAWKDVAAKYRGDAGAEARIADKIAKGGSGVWGGIAMPPNPRLSEGDRQALARFVLSLK